MEEFQELADEKGFQFLVILHPDLYELAEETYSFDASRLKRHLAEEHIASVDLMNYFASRAPTEEDQEKLYWRKDFHNTAAGYRIFADGVEEYLRKNRILERAWEEQRASGVERETGDPSASQRVHQVPE